MKNRYAEIVILAEDERSANLFRRYVMRALNIKDNRRLRQEISPPACGDAKQGVLTRYPIEVKSLRSRHPKTGLVVHIDADTESVNKRAAQLAATLTAHKLAAREENERISHAIPRRNTETWLCALQGIAVNEEQDCKRGKLLPDFDAVVHEAALKLYELTRPNAPPPTLPSLVPAIAELRRLEN